MSTSSLDNAPNISALLANLTQEQAYQALLADASLQALYCASDVAPVCGGLCANADIGGIGVRLAFYAQAVFNVILVFHSPDDSTSGQWAAVVLTLSLLIPAIIQKAQGNLTLFHASLVLNFATLSTLASLAVAPRCTVWRTEDGLSGPRREKRGRIVLSLALIVQLVSQWSWAVYMFTSPSYAQPECNASTLLLFFGAPLMVSQIDPHLRVPSPASEEEAYYFYTWPLWLLFSIGLTMAYFIILAVSSSSSLLPQAGSKLITPKPTGVAFNTPRSRGQSRVRSFSRERSHSRVGKGSLPPLPRHNSRLVAGMNRLLAYLPPLTWSWSSLSLLSHSLFALLFFLFLVLTTELQHARQPWLLPGENDVTTFGQMAALLLATAPVWSIGLIWFRGGAEVRGWEVLPLTYRQTWGRDDSGDEDEEEEGDEDGVVRGERQRTTTPVRRGRSKRVVVLSPDATPDGVGVVPLPGVGAEYDYAQVVDLSPPLEGEGGRRRQARRRQATGAYPGRRVISGGESASSLDAEVQRRGRGEDRLLLLVSSPEEERSSFEREMKGESVGQVAYERVDDARSAEAEEEDAEECKKQDEELVGRVLLAEEEGQRVVEEEGEEWIGDDERHEEDEDEDEDEDDIEGRGWEGHDHRVSATPPTLPMVEVAGPLAIDAFWLDGRPREAERDEDGIPLQDMRRT